MQMQTITQRLGTVTSVANTAGDASDVDETKQ